MQELTPPGPGRSVNDKATGRPVLPSPGVAGRLPLWAGLLAASLVCQVVTYWVLHANLQTVRFSDRIVDPSLLRGVSFEAKNSVYAIAILLAILGFLVITRVLASLVRFDAGTVPGVHITVETRIVGTLSAFTILLLCLSTLEAQRKGLDRFSAVLFAGIALALLVAVVKIALGGAGSKQTRKTYRLPGYSALLSMVLFCTVLPFAYKGCLNESCYLEWEELLAICLAAIALVGLYTVAGSRLAKRLRVGPARLDNVLTVALGPVMLIPLALPIANELQFTLSAVADIAPRSVWLFLTLLLVGASAGLTVRSLNRGPSWRASKLVRNFYFPVLVISSATFVNFDHFFRVGPAIDMFHWGELAVPVQQLFQFHSVPFLDLLPTHGLRDLLFQLAYTVVNGYRGLEMFVWTYWLNVAAAVLFYFLFARVFSPLFAVVLALGVPLSTIFTSQGPDYSVFIVVALCASRCAENLTLRRMTALWIVASCAFWWRYDLGFFSLAACLFLLVGFLIDKGRHEWKVVFLTAGVVAIIQFALFWALAAVRGHSALELIMQFRSQLKVLASGHGYGGIWPAWNAVAFLMYFILPAVCVGYIVYFLHQRWIAHRAVRPLAYTLVFLATVSLLLSFRNLHRHGLMENYKSLFAFFLLAAIPVLAHVSRRVAEFVFLALILIHTMVLGAYSWLTPANSQKLTEDLKRVFALQNSSEINFKTGPVFTFHHWHDKESRVRDLFDWQYRGLKPFFDRTLTSRQTFYDFSCATLLYVLTDREVVSYILQGQVHTGDHVQRYELHRMRARYDAGELPFVIFKQGRKWDVLDGVPNELRSYRIAEFIYRRYRPLGYIGSFQLWVANTFDRLSKTAEAPRQIHLPLRKDFEVRNGIKLDTADSQVGWRSAGPQTGALRFVDTRSVPPLDKDHYWFLRLVCRSSVSGQLSAYFVRSSNQGQASVIGFSMRADIDASGPNQWQEVTFNIPISSEGKTDTLGDIVLNTPQGADFEIRSANVLCAADPLFPRINQVEQKLDFGTLPFLWARYDEDGAWEKAPVLESKQVRQMCDPGNGLALGFDTVKDKDTGNFLQLRIQSDQETLASVDVPGDPGSRITFTVLGSPEPRDYVIRISCLYAWMSDPKAHIVLRSRQPIWVEDAIVRKGD